MAMFLALMNDISIIPVVYDNNTSEKCSCPTISTIWIGPYCAWSEDSSGTTSVTIVRGKIDHFDFYYAASFLFLYHNDVLSLSLR